MLDALREKATYLSPAVHHSSTFHVTVWWLPWSHRRQNEKQGFSCCSARRFMSATETEFLVLLTNPSAKSHHMTCPWCLAGRQHKGFRKCVATTAPCYGEIGEKAPLSTCSIATAADGLAWNKSGKLTSKNRENVTEKIVCLSKPSRTFHSFK